MNKYPSYFIGQVAGLDDALNVKQIGHGIRYRIRRIGVDSPSTPVEKLLAFDCLLPLTDGTGDGKKARSINLSVGDMVFGLHLDAPNNQRGVILGTLARTTLIQYDNYVKTEDLTTASGGDQGGSKTQPTPANRRA